MKRTQTLFTLSWFTPMAAFAVALSLSACGGAQEKVSFNSGGVSHTFAAGKDATPTTFPLPLYANAKPTGAVSTAGGDDQGSFLMLTSTDSVDTIGAFYRTKLKEDGWTVEQTQFVKGLINLAAHKGDMEASVMINTDGNTSSITLQAAKVQEGVPKVSNETFTPDKLNPPTD